MVGEKMISFNFDRAAGPGMRTSDVGVDKPWAQSQTCTGTPNIGAKLLVRWVRSTSMGKDFGET